MKKKLLIIGAVIAVSPVLYSFCGFYVSKADGTLKNKTSQVILVRDGNKNVITMYNDFKGDTKDFIGNEKIYYQDQLVFEQNFIGGIII